MVDMAGVVDRAFAGDRVKGAGVGMAEILDLAGVGDQSLLRHKADHRRNCLPGRPAGGAAHHDDFRGSPLRVEAEGKLREAELFAVVA